MATLSELATELTALARVETSEGLDGNLQSYVSDALTQHDPQLTVETLPVREEEAVLTLAWAKVCLVRASEYAKQANLSGAQGFGSDRNTPYYKNMSLADKLTKRYSDLCNSLRLGRNGVVVGTIFTRDAITDALVPLMQNTEMPRILLSSSSVTGMETSSVVLAWTMGAYTDMHEFIIFHLETEDANERVYQEWNYQSGHGIQKINDSAVKLTAISDVAVRSVKVQDLDRTKINRFLIVMRSRSNRFSYSNELLVAAL